MPAHRVTPILNVSDFAASVAWFGALGWAPGFEWGEPPSFGSVYSGHCEIFLCVGGQGGRGPRPHAPSFGPGSDEAAERGVWLSVWVDDVDALHATCLAHGIDVAWPPTDMPWGVREMHVRHPDGHVLRLSRGVRQDA
jgi:catechol 2,3-dioxygenase-like lactoylglutathione lyase family enzyme